MHHKLSVIVVMFLMVASHAIVGSDNHNVDLVIFSYDRPLQLYALLESTQRLITGLNKVHVIYRTSGPEYAVAYNQVQQAFPAVQMSLQGDNPHGDFKYLTMAAVYGSKSNYVVFAVDDIIVTGPIDLVACATMLEETAAYGCYLRLGKNTTWCYPSSNFQGLPPLQELGNGMATWNFWEGQGDWAYPNTVDMTLYRKREIESSLRAIDFHSPFAFEANWSCMVGAFMGRRGLCYEHSKMMNIPLNRVGEYPNKYMGFATAAELLEVFNQGFKIDITTLFGIDNVSAHMDYTPVFVEREVHNA